jgi:iron complex outermembrane receptor protein
VQRSRRHRFLASASLAGLIVLAFGTPANAADQIYTFDVPAEPLGQALVDFSKTTSQEIFFSEEETAGKSAPELHGQYTMADALRALLSSTDLTVDVNPAGVVGLTDILYQRD